MTPTILTSQIQPELFFLLIIIIFAVPFIVFWPKKGLVAKFSRMKMYNQRVQVEDALKYLFDCEYRNNVCNIDSIAGNLNVSGDNASRLLDRLLSIGLITMNDYTISLTDAGRSYALRVIRVHRIWERYLADETGVAQADWHNEADRLEHNVTREETEKLAAQMGNPVYDPHGDPIPTISGELPKPKGKLLGCLKKGEMGYIIHIEDEPRTIYEQLVVQGLYPGMQVYITDVTDKKITFAADGDECSLTLLFAAHITVDTLSEKKIVTEKFELLSSLEIGEKAEIVSISPNCRGQQRRRLMDLGIVPGGSITAEMKSALGDPIAYRIMGTTIGIRKQHANLIFINRKKEKTNEHSK
jgi:DtxR family Mn-dependent transcriptional regulator